MEPTSHANATTRSDVSAGAGVLAVRGLSKYYPGVVALDGVDLHLAEGSAHALVGENGAGKSTLIKILAGAIKPNAGEVTLAGRPVRFSSPLSARRAGIAVVHQHSHLIPDLTLAENFALRQGYPRRAGMIDWRTLRYEAAQAVHLMIPGMDITRRASTLSGVEKQMVEISFALAAKPRVLILDEPTAILPYAETNRLFRMVRAFLAGDGAVLFVSHRLDEVFDLCDTVTVLRDGRLVWSKPTTETDHDDLIRGMVGRGVSFERDATLIPRDEPKLTVDNFSDNSGAFAKVNLKLRAGEIYGIYGLVGAGQSELCAALLGLRGSHGSVALVGEDQQEVPLKNRSAGSRVRRGLALVPAERLERGMFRQMTVGENMSIASLGQKSLLGLVRPGREAAENSASIKDLRVKATGPHQKALQLSGGNQQKVLLARWLQTEPQVLILEEPTQGVDVGAKMEIHRLIREQARRGVGILLVSSELPELLALSHRIGIMRQGHLVSEMEGDAATEEEILRLALPPQENMPDDQDHQASEKHQQPVKAAVPRGPLSRLLLRRETGLAVLLLLIIAAAILFVPNFSTWENFRDILKSQAILLLGALGVGAVIIAGGIDISIGAILGLAALVAAKADVKGLPAAAIVAAPLAVGLVLGAINGLLTVFGRVHSIVITLGMMFILQGVMLEIMDNKWIFNLSDNLTNLGRGNAGPVPYLIICGAIGVVLTAFLLRSTVTGRRFYALGGDRPSAELLGLNPRVVLPLAFAFSGLLVGLAGLMHAGFYGQVQTTAGRGFELKAIAAAVIGGTHIMGGRGSAFGILLGALLLGVISNLLVFLHISAFWDNAVTGMVILVAVVADALTSRREGAHT